MCARGSTGRRKNGRRRERGKEQTSVQTASAHEKRCVVAQSSWAALCAQTQARTKGDLKAAFFWRLYQTARLAGGRNRRVKVERSKASKDGRIVVFRAALLAAQLATRAVCSVSSVLGVVWWKRERATTHLLCDAICGVWCV